ncbi:hypothetical protein [Janthinobacterium aquaticum]|uniref:hypothetical protein n=1 Tax=Janthinobacterium sp. FT58W TaxID=2654254 RepID=UPI001264A14E|nr:hypothetical protein [Janthinobacterium sp. FT58W]KAB8044343.1 hypothetical protein GCM43_03815 [Janthinobacterium sp. FT58W]
MRKWIGCTAWFCVVALASAQEAMTPASNATMQTPAQHAVQDATPEPAQPERKPEAQAALPAVSPEPAHQPVETVEPATPLQAPQTVTVKGSSDASPPRVRFTAYRDSYETAKKVWEVSRGNVVMALRLIPAKVSGTIDDVRVALQGNGAPVSVRVTEGGVFVVPINDEIAAQDGVFLVNKGRGELTASMVIQPAVAREAWTLERVAHVLRDARLAVRAITPWYKRWFSSEVKSLAFCAPERGSALQLKDGEQLIATLPMSEAAVNDINQPVYCKMFDGEDKYPGQYRLVMPDEASVLIL